MMAKSTDRAVAVDFRKLETELSVLDRGIKNHPDDGKYHYSKAVALKKLAYIMGSNEKYAEALTSFNKAIELDSENPLYIIKRAGLLVAMNRDQEAFDDLQTAIELAEEILVKSLGDLSIEEMATVNAIRDVAELNLQEAFEQKSVTMHLPRDNNTISQSNFSTVHKLESTKDRLIETEEQVEAEIAGVAENYNICFYCGY